MICHLLYGLPIQSQERARDAMQREARDRMQAEQRRREMALDKQEDARRREQERQRDMNQRQGMPPIGGFEFPNFGNPPAVNLPPAKPPMPAAPPKPPRPAPPEPEKLTAADVDAILESLKSDDVTTVVAALRRLANADMWIRVSAIDVLSKVGGQSATEALAAAVESDTEEFVRSRAQSALRELQSRPAVDAG
jgi:hypothetical protein